MFCFFKKGNSIKIVCDLVWCNPKCRKMENLMFNSRKEARKWNENFSASNGNEKFTITPLTNRLLQSEYIYSYDYRVFCNVERNMALDSDFDEGQECHKSVPASPVWCWRACVSRQVLFIMAAVVWKDSMVPLDENSRDHRCDCKAQIKMLGHMAQVYLQHIKQHQSQSKNLLIHHTINFTLWAGQIL